MFEVLSHLGENFAAIFALVFLFCAFSHSIQKSRPLVGALLDGMLFGLVAIFSMSHPIRILEGVIIDARVVLVALAGVFGGPGAAAVAGLAVSAFRWHLGGAGAVAGIVAILAAAAIGTFFRWGRLQAGGHPTRSLALLGLALAAAALSATFLLPWNLTFPAFRSFFLPVLILYPLATVVFGSLFGFEISRQTTIAKLLRSESMLRTISNNFQEGMIYQVHLEPDGKRRFTYLSDSVRVLYGVSPEEGMRDASLIYTRIVEDDLAIMLAEEDRARKTLSTFKAEARIRDPSGAIRWSSFASRPRSWPDGSITWDGIEFLITDRKRAEEERRKLDERAGNARKLEALGVLVAGVAHNINNVLAAVMGTASVQESTAKDPEDREAFTRIVTACKRGRDVVRSLMQFARPTLSDQGPIELRSLLSELRQLLANSTTSRVRIEEEYLTESVWIRGDAGNLSNSFMNLCLNAIDAMPDGGTIRIALDDSTAEEAVVAFTDTGEGMAPETLARVMEPFFTTKPTGKGTGLGLSMTHGVVKAHGGTMEIESTPGVGTTIRIRLPRIAAPGSSEREAPGPAPLATRKILLVDDDDDVRVLVARMLKAKGLEVESVGSGQAALERLAKGELPDLVILDQNMPGLDGIQTMERIRARNTSIPILISSGQPDIQDWLCFRQPNTAVLSKPFDMAELEAKLARFSNATA